MITTTTFYSGSNGDRWLMLRHGDTGRYVVRHEPNMSSGGKATDVDEPEFLSRNSATPQGDRAAGASCEGHRRDAFLGLAKPCAKHDVAF
jgi:hypothetical protein